MFYGIRAKSKDILARLVNKVSENGDLYAPVEMKKRYPDLGETDTFVCLQYLEGKGLIHLNAKDDSYLITLTADAVDYVEPEP